MSEPIKITDEEAKEIIKKYGLKWRWDKDIKQADIKCPCGEWFSNPSRGMVRELRLVDENNRFISFARDDNNDLVVVNKYELSHSPKYVADLVKMGYIVFKGRCYEIVPDEGETKWVFKTFFNKQEFEEFVKINPQYTSEGFDRFWRNNKFTNEKNSPVGRAYRVISSGEIYSADEPTPDSCKCKIADKVISFGFWQTSNPKLTRCPLCEEVHRIGYYRAALPWRFKRKEKKGK